MIRPGTEADIEAFLEPLRTLIAGMNAAGNDQWGPHYPVRADFLSDFTEGSLFVEVADTGVRGFAALNFTEPSEYDALPWTVGRPALVVHRLAVLPGFQRQGVADGLFAFAEDRAQALGLGGLRSDTSQVNTAMNALFAKRGWRFVGTLNFSDATVGFRGWEKSVQTG